ncbi:hypothetical protein EI94DRAFT_1028773 [Lactarius quietus]|nr:hypothetical protein EI94DRAFT_1028773 [Lactarius quietus]
MSEANRSDEEFIKSLDHETNVMALVHGIFASIIASFIIQTSQNLLPNNNQETVCLLSQLVPQGNSSRQSIPFCPGPYPGEPSTEAIRSNILLLLSFFIVMANVVTCGLIHQWCDEFKKYANPRAAPHKRGRVRTYLLEGLDQFFITAFMYGVHVLLHTSVLLFFCGVSDYLYDLYPTVGLVSWSCVAVSTVAYVVLSILPLFIPNCPYQTALTHPLRFGSKVLPFLGRTAWQWLRRSKERSSTWKTLYKSFCDACYFDKNHFLLKAVKSGSRATRLDLHAMKWLFTVNDFSDIDMDKFLKGLPGYIGSTFAAPEDLPKVLTARYLHLRIKEHLLTCVTETDSDLPEEARLNRVSVCVDSLREILKCRASDNGPTNTDERESPLSFMQSIVDDLNTLCKPQKGELRAFCVRALVFHGFLTKFLEPASKGSSDVEAPVKVPDYFIPLYNFFSSAKLQQDNVSPALVSNEVPPPDEGKMRQTILHDSLFINLTLLAEAILSHDDDVGPSSLSLCWKTLDILRSENQITRTDVCGPSLGMFDEIHNKTRRRVNAEQPGFSVGPLLEILGAVDGGRRLSVVFRDYPDPKYHCKADLVFGKDHLRNPDLFRAFAHCLPRFVTDRPEKSVELMEGLVLRDHLWLVCRPTSRIPWKTIALFKPCCTSLRCAVLLSTRRSWHWRTRGMWTFENSTLDPLRITSNYFPLIVSRESSSRGPLPSASASSKLDSAEPS